MAVPQQTCCGVGARRPPALLVAVSTRQGPCQPSARTGAQRALRGDKRAAPQPSGSLGSTRGKGMVAASGRRPRECASHARLGGNLLHVPAAREAEPCGVSALEDREACDDVTEGHSGGLGEGAEERGQSGGSSPHSLGAPPSTQGGRCLGKWLGSHSTP